MNARREQFRDWVCGKYGGRMIPVSGEPYFHHVLTVAELAASYATLGYEAGLCHDMLEDGICKLTELQAVLYALAYTAPEIAAVREAAIELTDVFTARAYPGLSKKKRKKKEEDRLAGASPLAQTVKYADLIYNMDWTVRYQVRKVKRYLKRKLNLLKMMNKGDPELRGLAIKAVRKHLKTYPNS